ncbi:hypothetical protein OG496_50115 [Streptomyces sp. NBC_00988]|uniref:hypothetical protein n=1 Tax=Streptomyces sp. NBC_00988 TaxID=2903704 RepID=UPI00386A4372|nr:hypothetical protein OG496_50115 [Streptomyces sp. NBC_00988]
MVDPFGEPVGGEQLVLDFTPSYVRAGSAHAALRTADGEHRFGPYPSNGYEAEWQHLADLAHRTAVPRYDVGRLVDDLAYAVDIAERAATVQHSEGAALRRPPHLRWPSSSTRPSMCRSPTARSPACPSGCAAPRPGPPTWWR